MRTRWPLACAALTLVIVLHLAVELIPIVLEAARYGGLPLEP